MQNQIKVWYSLLSTMECHYLSQSMNKRKSIPQMLASVHQSYLSNAVREQQRNDRIMPRDHCTDNQDQLTGNVNHGLSLVRLLPFPPFSPPLSSNLHHPPVLPQQHFPPIPATPPLCPPTSTPPPAGPGSVLLVSIILFLISAASE